MKYNNAMPEGRWKLLIIGLLVKIITEIKQQNIIYDQNSMSIKEIHNRIKLATEKT